MKKLNKKGFTLVELIVVIAIIGILAAVLVPSVTSYIGKAQKSSAQQTAANLYQEFVLALVDETVPFTIKPPSPLLVNLASS